MSAASIETVNALKVKFKQMMEESGYSREEV